MTSPQGDDLDGMMRMDDAMARYKEGLYLYTVSRGEKESVLAGPKLILVSYLARSSSTMFLRLHDTARIIYPGEINFNAEGIVDEWFESWDQAKRE